MRPGKRSRAELRMDCLRRVARWGVTGFRKEVLVNWIETYVKLSDEDAAEFQRLLEQEENMEVREMELTWLGEAEARGEERGIEKGMAQGMALALEQMKRSVLQRVEQRFGALPARLQRKVQATDSVDPLVEMIARLPFVESADELVPEG